MTVCRQVGCDGLHYPILEYRSRRDGSLLRTRDPATLDELIEIPLHPPPGESVTEAMVRCQCGEDEAPKAVAPEEETESVEEPLRPWWADKERESDDGKSH